MTKKQTCKNCKYFKETRIVKSESTREILNYQGDCMRFPPIKDVYNNFFFPKVDAFTWCGEYKSKKTK